MRGRRQARPKRRRGCALALDGSGLAAAGAARRVQDPLSFRCVAQVHGAAHDALAHACQHVEIELNAAADSPLVDAGENRLLSTGNFYIPGLALAHETVGTCRRTGGFAARRALHQALIVICYGIAATTHAPWPAAIGLRHHAENR
jgi:histidine ammonia-lyase